MKGRTVEELDSVGKIRTLLDPCLGRAKDDQVGHLGLLCAPSGFCGATLPRRAWSFALRSSADDFPNTSSFTRIVSSFHTFSLLVYNEGVIFAESGPRPTRHFAKVHKPPVG